MEKKRYFVSAAIAKVKKTRSKTPPVPMTAIIHPMFSVCHHGAHRAAFVHHAPPNPLQVFCMQEAAEKRRNAKQGKRYGVIIEMLLVHAP